MNGETSLTKLLTRLSPKLNPGEYVFCCVQEVTPEQLCTALGSFREDEGQTLILSRIDAQRFGLDYHYQAAWITLEVHSALAAVGLTAAFSTALAAAGISCNVIAGYHHDHLFVATADAQRALDVLQQLSQGSY